jgi:hypothetical protein
VGVARENRANGTRRALLLVAASLGFGMLTLWLQRCQATPALATAGGSGSGTTADGSTPAEQRFPVPMVAAHLIAATTLVLVLLAALGIGGS